MNNLAQKMYKKAISVHSAVVKEEYRGMLDLIKSKAAKGHIAISLEVSERYGALLVDLLLKDGFKAYLSPQGRSDVLRWVDVGWGK